MARAQVPFYALNAGEVSSTALARIDLEKMRMAAESMVNFIPTVLGPMGVRPGMKYLSSTLSNLKTKLIPFIYNASTTSLLEISASGLRVRTADALVTYVDNSTSIVGGDFSGVPATYTRSLTTVTVSKTAHGLTNGMVIYLRATSGGMASNYYTVAGATANTFTVTTSSSGTISTSSCLIFAGWTDASDSGADLTFTDAAVLGSTRYNIARMRQTVTIAGADQAKRHCVKIVIASGPVTFRIGSALGGADIISDQALDEGTHFISFTPNAGTIYLEFVATEANEADRKVQSIAIYKNADLLIPTPWAEADIQNIRYDQSGSVIFIACSGYPPYKIERRGPNSWGVAKYLPSAGPYLSYSSKRVRMKSTARKGSVTITSDIDFFNANMVGSLFQITHPQQQTSIRFTGDNQYGDYIRVVGVGSTDRQFTFSIGSGIGSATVTLERAFGVPEGWTTVKTYTSTASGTLDDSTATAPFTASANGQIVYYRFSTRSGAGVSSAFTCTLTYEGGQTIGSFRITGYTSPTSVSADVVSPIGASNQFTDDWRQGAWSNDQSWPSSVTFHDGRLWWAGLDKVYGSVSDDFYNFDPETEGDAGPIVRSVATGPVEGIGWMLSLQRLLVGTASAEVSIRSSSFDEPLTPTAFTARNASTIGSSGLQALALDSSGIYVQRNRSKIFELGYDVDANDYGSRELTRLNQEICQPGVSDMAVQRQPDTRIWFVKDDGTVAMLLYDKADAVVGWCRLETDGLIENVTVLPTGSSDDVYFVVNRTINGVTKRYIEKLNTAAADARNLCDASYNWTSGSPTTSVTGLAHLAGKQVTVFSPNATGFAVVPATYTVSAGGTFTLSSAQTNLIIGLPFTAKFKSVKLAYGSAAGTALTQKKRVDHLALVGTDIAPDGIKVGRDFSNLSGLARIYMGKPLTAGQLIADWDYDASTFNGGFDTDSRLCIQVTAPYPANISGMVINMKNNDRG